MEITNSSMLIFNLLKCLNMKLIHNFMEIEMYQSRPTNMAPELNLFALYYK